MADRMITVVGDTIDLYVESNEPIETAVEVQFQRVPVGPAPKQGTSFINIQFKENLIAVPVPLREPNQAKGLFAARIKWKVNLNHDPSLEKDTAVLVAIVRGKSQTTGRTLVAQIRDLLFIQAIDITTDPKLTRIMLHEFARANQNTFIFNPQPLENFVHSLSVEQKKMLCNIAEQNPSGRLVVFVTFYDTSKKQLRMFADNGGGNHSIRPNATFSVFHCRDVDKGGITLVCHTEHFVVHFLNGSTRKWILGKEGPKKQFANDYMQKTNPEPILYKLVAHLPADAQGHDGVIWCSPFRTNGKSIMPGNFIHGIVNTLGCWMLFRNYNWPRSVAIEFDKLYRFGRRPNIRFAPKKFVPELEKISDSQSRRYDFHNPPDLPPQGFSSSGRKYLRLDMNYAHLWFFHEIVGIKYFSSTISFIGPCINDRNTHGFTFENTFPLAQAGLAPAFNLLEEGSFAAYDPDDRRKQDKKFRQDDSLWRDNALGFRTSEGFVPSFARAISPKELKTKSWADLFFYKEDDVDLGPSSHLIRSDAAFVPGT